MATPSEFPAPIEKLRLLIRPMAALPQTGIIRPPPKTQSANLQVNLSNSSESPAVTILPMNFEPPESQKFKFVTYFEPW
ncbi:Hypothetical protein NTJ_05726 [Nesidiocoris tenuis]|uniref:Uncharacterized protein n=1 Tax=Nesidiocoris tenuis TaxID=355587 RepID=A0ABN7ARD1_9HEMI|nr:Hypothetical protein NTJ_05726 [Nesidiocoris tenuis]